MAPKIRLAVDEFEYLDEKIVNLHPQVLQLPGLEQMWNHLNTQHTNAVNHLAELKKKTLKEFNDWEGLKAGTNFKAFKAKLTGKTSEKLVKEERQYVEAKAQEEDWIHKVEAVKQQLAQATKDRDVMRSKKSALDGLHAQLNALLDRTFVGQTLEYPEEDKIEKDVHLAYSYILQAGQDLPRWEQLVRTLKAAQHELVSAIQVMSSASMMATVDMFSDNRFADVAKQQQVMQARQHATMCNSYIQQAQALMPGLPTLRQFRVNGMEMLVRWCSFEAKFDSLTCSSTTSLWIF